MATEYYGAGARVGFAKESAWNTLAAGFGGAGPAAVPHMLGILSQSIDAPDKELDVRQYRSVGTGRKWFTSKPGRRARGSSITFLPTTPEMFLYCFAGRGDQTPAYSGYTASGAGPVYTHKFRTANVAKLVSFNLGMDLIGTPSFQRIFTGGQVDSLNLNLSEVGELEMGLDMKFAGVQNAGAATIVPIVQPTQDAYGTPTALYGAPSFDSVAPYMFYDRNSAIRFGGTYDYATGAYAGGRTLARVKSFSASLSNSLKELYFTQDVNSQNPFDFVLSNPEFSLSLEMVPVGKLASENSGNDVIYDLLESEAAFDVSIPFQRPNGDTLTLVFSGCRIKTAPHNIPDDGGEVVVSVEFAVSEFGVVATDKVANYSLLV